MGFVSLSRGYVYHILHWRAARISDKDISNLPLIVSLAFEQIPTLCGIMVEVHSASVLYEAEEHLLAELGGLQLCRHCRRRRAAFDGGSTLASVFSPSVLRSAWR